MGKGWKKRALAEKMRREVAEAFSLSLPVEGEQQKQQIQKPRERHPHKRRPSFSPEPTGSYVVATESGSRLVDMFHGEIVNRLADELTALGYQVANTGLTGDAKPDLVVFGDKKAIIEVKVGGTLHDAIEILGQLFIYDYMLVDFRTFPNLAQDPPPSK